MANFWDIVKAVIAESDIMLMILDSRFPRETQNIEVEQKIRNANKVLIYVLNKCDLISKHEQKKAASKLSPSVFVSSTIKYGKTILRNKILQYSANRDVNVGVVGYPNTGKSSVINLLKGKTSAPVSSRSGYTTGLQKVRADNRILLIDSPGVIPFKENDKLKHMMIGTIDSSNPKDPEGFVHSIFKKYPGVLENHYSIKGDDPDEKLEFLALKMNKLKKGGIPDGYSAAVMIMRDWQKGRISLESIE